MSSRFSALRPGPKLAKRLAAVELGSLPDDQLIDYLHAEVRQLSSQQARVWAAMAEVARRVPSQAFEPNSGWTSERVLDSAVLEIATELRVSRLSAEHELDHARAVEAMPAVAAALRAGDLDRSRVLVLLDVCGDLPDEHHRNDVIAQVLPDAGRMPAGKLREKAQRIAMALDPAWAERRYREAVKRKRVVRYINHDGSVTIAAEDQDAAEALAAYARLTALAKAAKHAGASATLDVLRSDLSLGLLGPRFAGLRDTDLVAYLVQQYPKAAPELIEDPVPSDESVDAEPSDEPVDAEPGDDEVTERFRDEEWLERFWYGEPADEHPPEPEHQPGRRFADRPPTGPLPRNVRPLRPPPLPPTGTDPDPDPPPF